MLVEGPHKPNRKLVLSKETVRVLAGSKLSGGAFAELSDTPGTGGCQSGETRQPCSSGDPTSRPPAPGTRGCPHGPPSHQTETMPPKSA
jgi:hypothetical protein